MTKYYVDHLGVRITRNSASNRVYTVCIVSVSSVAEGRVQAGLPLEQTEMETIRTDVAAAVYFALAVNPQAAISNGGLYQAQAVTCPATLALLAKPL